MKQLSLWQRFQLAWAAFNLKPFEKIILPFAKNGTLTKVDECDNARRVTKCKNIGEVCISRKSIKLTIETTDHYHVCNQCANRIIGTFEDDDFEYETEKHG